MEPFLRCLTPDGTLRPPPAWGISAADCRRVAAASFKASARLLEGRLFAPPLAAPGGTALCACPPPQPAAVYCALPRRRTPRAPRPGREDRAPSGCWFTLSLPAPVAYAGLETRRGCRSSTCPRARFRCGFRTRRRAQPSRARPLSPRPADTPRPQPPRQDRSQRGGGTALTKAGAAPAVDAAARRRPGCCGFRRPGSAPAAGAASAGLDAPEPVAVKGGPGRVSCRERRRLGEGGAPGGGGGGLSGGAAANLARPSWGLPAVGVTRPRQADRPPLRLPRRAGCRGALDVAEDGLGHSDAPTGAARRRWPRARHVLRPDVA